MFIIFKKNLRQEHIILLAPTIIQQTFLVKNNLTLVLANSPLVIISHHLDAIHHHIFLLLNHVRNRSDSN